MTKLLSKPLSRRMFMKASPGAAVAGQQVVAAQVKKVAAQSALAAQGVSAATSMGGHPISDSETEHPWSRVQRMAVDTLRRGSIPKHLRLNIEMQAKQRSRVIDPDIDAMHSLSEIKKRQMQYDRAFSDVIAEMIAEDEATEAHNSLIEKARRAISSKLGIA
jgi:hypothetical protein